MAGQVDPNMNVGNVALVGAKGLTEHHGVVDYIRDITRTKRINLLPPRIVNIAANTNPAAPVLAFIGIRGNKHRIIRIIINVGTVPILVSLLGSGLDAANVAVNPDNYHWPLAAGSAVNNGTGGAIDIGQFPYDAWVYADGGAGRISIIEAEEC